MAASVNSPADVVNLALAGIGFKKRVGQLYEGSEAAKIALTVYSQTRDAVLRSSDWGFAERFVASSATGGAAPPPWTQELQYPQDCLRVRDLFTPAYLADINNPLPVLWTIGNDGGLASRVIWTRVVAATICYTGQVTNPALWDPLFVSLFAVELGKQLASSLVNMEAIKMLASEESAQAPVAVGTLG